MKMLPLKPIMWGRREMQNNVPSDTFDNVIHFMIKLINSFLKLSISIESIEKSIKILFFLHNCLKICPNKQTLDKFNSDSLNLYKSVFLIVTGIIIFLQIYDNSGLISKLFTFSLLN